MQILNMLQAVARWKQLAEESRWDEFVAAMLQEHYDAVYTRAQLKYLTPSSNPSDETEPANRATDSSHEHEHENEQQEHQQQPSSQQQQQQQQQQIGDDGQVDNDRQQAARQSSDNSNDHDDTVQAAGALSHLFGGPRSKLMQQMGTKQLESTLRWHREPVADITDEIYADLATKLLQQYDPAALSATHN